MTTDLPRQPAHMVPHAAPDGHVPKPTVFTGGPAPRSATCWPQMAMYQSLQYSPGGPAPRGATCCPRCRSRCRAGPQACPPAAPAPEAAAAGHPEYHTQRDSARIPGEQRENCSCLHGWPSLHSNSIKLSTMLLSQEKLTHSAWELMSLDLKIFFNQLLKPNKRWCLTIFHTTYS